MADLAERYKRDPSIVSREVVGEYILVPIRHNVGDLESIYSLNETAARAWEMIDGRRSLQEIANQIVSEFEAESEQVAADLLELIAQLEEIGALTIA